MGTRVSAAVGAVSLTGHEFVFTVTIDVDPLHIVILGIIRIDGMPDPAVFAGLELMFYPVEAIVMGAPDNQVVDPVSGNVTTRMGTLALSSIGNPGCHIQSASQVSSGASSQPSLSTISMRPFPAMSPHPRPCS